MSDIRLSFIIIGTAVNFKAFHKNALTHGHVKSRPLQSAMYLRLNTSGFRAVKATPIQCHLKTAPTAANGAPLPCGPAHPRSEKDCPE